MDSLVAYIPMDRRQAMAKKEDLPDRATGTALFADISGFTALTELLTQELGDKEGAEELTKHLNVIYSALITEIHRYRGSIIGFSGDAITCWFDDTTSLEPASLRAMTSALAMQQVMRQFAAIQTPFGQSIEITIKVAVTSGPVRRFRVGDPRIQYMDVLAGETMKRLAAIEKQANRGEVLAGTEIIRQLAGRVQIINERGLESHLCQIVTGLVEPAESDPWPAFPNVELNEAEDIRSWILPPVYRRLKIGQAQFLAEIRPATALFLNFGEPDYDGDDEAGLKLDAYIRWVQNVLNQYNSHLLQLTIGDKGSYLYSAFGAPLSHGDDTSRAIAAALTLRSPPSNQNFITGAQIGLSRGRMRTGAYGSLTRCTYGVLGDQVNVAARLMSHAKSGQILATEHVTRVTLKDFFFKDEGRLKLKGKGATLATFLVQDRRPPSFQPLTAIFPTPPVGRETELAQMSQILEKVQRSQGQLIRLEGAAGIGKSHLAAEFIRHALSLQAQVSVGSCQNSTQEIPYYPWQQIFRAALKLTSESSIEEEPRAEATQQIVQVEAIVNSINPKWSLRLPLLGDLLGLSIPDNPTTADLDPKKRQEMLFSLAIELIQSLVANRPMVILIEDIQWLDEASQELTLALARVLAEIPVLLILAHRSSQTRTIPISPMLEGLPGYHHLNLNELGPTAVATLVASRLQGQVSTLTLSLIQTWAQGNPFFTEEVIETLRETGKLLWLKGEWRLSQAVTNTLQAANCLSWDQDSGERRLVPHAPLPLAALGLPDTVYDIVLARLDRMPDEAKMTLKVASVIGSPFEFDLLSRAHPLQSDSNILLSQLEEMEARDFIRLELLSSQLIYIFKHNITQEVAYETLLTDQRRQLHQAVAETLEIMQPERVERLAYHYWHSSVRSKMLFYLDQAGSKAQREYANETALNYYNQALTLEKRWEWRKGQVEVLHILGRREEEWAALQALAADPAAPAFEVAYLWGQYYEATGDFPKAGEETRQALAISRDLKDLPKEVRSLAQLGLIAFRQGDYEQAKVWYHRSLALLEQQDSQLNEKMQILNGLGRVYRQQGAFEQATACHQQALAFSQQQRDRVGEAETLNHLGVTASYRGDLAKAQEYHHQALRIQRSMGDRTGEGVSLGNLAQVVLDIGDYGQAEKYLIDTLAILQATASRWNEVNAWNDLGILYLLVGDLLEAQACFDRGLSLSRKIGDEVGRAYLLCNLGQIARDQGNLIEAENYLAESQAIAVAQGERSLVAMCISHAALVSLEGSRMEQAIERASQALRIRQEVGLPLLTTLDLTTLARAHLALGGSTQALAYVQQAITILEESGGEGPEFPQRDYFRGYQVLTTLGQLDQAQAALQAAYDLLMTRAGKITNPALQQSFLERVPMHREIITCFRGITS